MTSPINPADDDATRMWRGGSGSGGPPVTYSVGRGVNCDVVIADDSVSRLHALITLTPQGVAVEDQGSANGTWVNGKEVNGSVMAPVGSQIGFGHAVRYVTMSADGTVATLTDAPPPGGTAGGGGSDFAGAMRDASASVRSRVPAQWWKTTPGIIGITAAAVMGLAVAAFAIVLLATAGSDVAEQQGGYHDIATLQASIESTVESNLAEEGYSVRVDGVSCIKAESGEYTCLVELSDGERQTLIVTVDEAGQNWISR